MEAEGFDPYIATGRQKHHATEPIATEPIATEPIATEPIATEPATAESGSAEDDSVAGGSISTAKPTVKERMSQKLRGAAGKKIYAARKAIIEPVFGQIKQARGLRNYLLRGLEKVDAEWKFICLTHNLLKIWRFKSSTA